ncbi:MAG: hypothetical protein FWG40_08965 [Peptococcaceae bacterium]|nr:hypothetical protein [Peptococcaceae bacterium]
MSEIVMVFLAMSILVAILRVIPNLNPTQYRNPVLPYSSEELQELRRQIKALQDQVNKHLCEKGG